LQRLSGRTFMKYSLARIYQLRENIAFMKMMLKMAGPFSKFTTPAMLFYLIYILLPRTRENEFIRNFSVAMFDWWLAVLSLAAAFSFPFADFRFRRVAIQLPIYRNLMKKKNVNSAKVFASKHVADDVTQATDVYFRILERE
ncbi:hypothetical protein PMAYCL1PPCAC_15372, partial [Pristionchus mayeri]